MGEKIIGLIPDEDIKGGMRIAYSGVVPTENLGGFSLEEHSDLVLMAMQISAWLGGTDPNFADDQQLQFLMQERVHPNDEVGLLMQVDKFQFSHGKSQDPKAEVAAVEKKIGDQRRVVLQVRKKQE